MSEEIRWGIIGCGDVTERKSGPAYQKTPGFSLDAVMRRDVMKAADYAKRHQVPKYYAAADDLINDPEIDAIYIATPPDTHEFYALKVAAAGKPCCIEKPMAPTYEACISICNAFDHKNIPLFVAYYRRSLPRFNQVKQWIDEQRIGDIRHIQWHLSKPSSPKDISGEYNWRTDATIAAGGYFDDLASHGLDLFVHFLGKVEQVFGIATNQQKLYTADDAIVGCWKHVSGVTGTGSWNFGSNKREDKVEISGSLGTITFSVFHEEPIRLITKDENIELTIAHPENIQLYHVHNMREHLLGNLIHPSTGRTAAHSSWIMDGILGKSVRKYNF
jgi:1,5-anhydro-D-fructose reductase (1,5-anhydro-D-mannitol-forming)